MHINTTALSKFQHEGFFMNFK